MFNPSKEKKDNSKEEDVLILKFTTFILVVLDPIHMYLRLFVKTPTQPQHNRWV